MMMEILSVFLSVANIFLSSNEFCVLVYLQYAACVAYCRSASQCHSNGILLVSQYWSKGASKTKLKDTNYNFPMNITFLAYFVCIRHQNWI